MTGTGSARLRGFTGAPATQVFAATFVFVALFELIFKAHVIFSHALFLDDLFYFERSLSGLTFNGLETAPQDVPSGQGADFTPNLQLYRALASGLGDIVLLRLVHLAVFCLDAALLALVLRPLIKDRFLTVLTAAFACLTPFSHILIIFANGSYFVWFFLFYFGAFLSWRRVDFRSGDMRSTWTWILVGAVLAMLAALTVDSGILLLWPLYLFLLWNARAWNARQGRVTATMLALLLTVFTWHTIASIHHPYTSIAGRLNYSPFAILKNGLYILSHMIWRYVEPMAYTGFSVARENVWPAAVLILGTTAGLAISFMAAQARFLVRLAQSQVLQTLGFFLLATLVSIGPYTIQTVTHIWHYFPHMLFLIPSIILILVIVMPRWGAYSVILVCAVLTVSAYLQTMPNYILSVSRQKAIANFIQANTKDIREHDPIVVTIDTRELASGLMNTNNFSSFARHVTSDPFLPKIEVLQIVANSKTKADLPLEQSGATNIRIRGGFESISLIKPPVWETTEHVSFNATGSNELTLPVGLAPTTSVRLTVKLSPDHRVDQDQPYSTTFPPMPLHATHISIYQKSSGFHITSDDVASIVSDDLTAAIRIVGVEGSYYEAEIYSLEIQSLNGNWTLGRGFNDRYWQGHIDLTIETAPR